MICHFLVYFSAVESSKTCHQRRKLFIFLHTNQRPQQQVSGKLCYSICLTMGALPMATAEGMLKSPLCSRARLNAENNSCLVCMSSFHHPCTGSTLYCRYVRRLVRNTGSSLEQYLDQAKVEAVDELFIYSWARMMGKHVVILYRGGVWTTQQVLCIETADVVLGYLGHVWYHTSVEQKPGNTYFNVNHLCAVHATKC
jgi:hypothetical protein